MDKYDSVLLLLITIHIVVCPFTKVEESFNVQATHDLLYHREHLERYDHFEFPGVVPRTFIGPLFLSTLALPAVYIQHWLGYPKLFSLYAIRFLLGFISVLSIASFRRACALRTTDKTLSILIAVIVASQFHLMFYSSRLLPNTFSLIFCNFANSAWLSDRPYVSLILFAFNSAVFRSDCVVFAFPILFLLLFRGRIKFRQALVVGIAATFASAMYSIAVDSVFWKRLLWPELSVFVFNVIENRSSEWGVYPFHAYYTSFLPKSLLMAALFIPFGFLTSLPRFSILKKAHFNLNLNPTAVELGVPAFISIFLYSFLPHKEIRFLFPALLPLNTVAAMGILSLYRSVKSKKLRSIFITFVCMSTFASFSASLFFLYASKFNYPGGLALQKVNTIADKNVSIHIDNLAAISGVTRFGELEGRSILYDKTEGLSDDDLSQGFDFLIHESIVRGFEVVESVKGYDRIDFKNLPPEVKLSTKLYILKRFR